MKVVALLGGAALLVLLIFGGHMLFSKNSPYSIVGTSTLSGTTGGTTGQPAGGIPGAVTGSATAITAVSAKISGKVIPNQPTALYWFEYGKDKNELDIVLESHKIENASSSVPVSATLQGLAPATTYYYRVIAYNEFGPVAGEALSFKTAPPATFTVPVVTTQLPSAVSTTTATLSGTVNPRGTAATYWFEYATDSAFGVGSKTTAHKPTGAGTTTISIAQSVSGLTNATTYYYRTVVQNVGGTVKGDSITFKTK